MTNLTLSIDEDLLRRARMRALERGTSVDAALRDFLEEFVTDPSTRDEAVDGLLTLSARARSRSGRRTWTRAELHE